MPEQPKPPPPPPPPGGGEGKVAEGAFIQWMKDVFTGPYSDKEKEAAVENAYKDRLK